MISGIGQWEKSPGGERHSLELRLRSVMVDTVYERKFLPLDRLQDIITVDAVQAELWAQRDRISSPGRSILRDIIHGSSSAQDDVDMESFAKQICNEHRFYDKRVGSEELTSRQKIFATLVLTGQSWRIEDFSRAGLYDSDLPMAITKGDKSGVWVLRPDRAGDEQLKRQDRQIGGGEWAVVDMEAFERVQWQLIAPYFTRSHDPSVKVHFYHLRQKDVLPFIPFPQPENHEVSEGHRGGMVEVVKIHAAHHNLLVDSVSDQQQIPKRRQPDL